MTLTQDQRELLERLREENNAAGFPFTPTDHWMTVNQVFEGWFEKHGIGDIQSQPFNDHFAGFVHQHPQVQQAWFEWMTEQYGEHDHDNCQDLYNEMLGVWGCKLHVMVGMMLYCPPHKLPWDVLTACEAAYFIENHHRWREVFFRVLDLGGGWGRMAVPFRMLNKKLTYIDCDLPESLLIASEFLPRFIDEPSPLPVGEYQFDPGIYFIPAYKIESIPDGSLDLIINMASFQEMPPDQIDAYCEIIGRKAFYFYTMQRDALGSFSGMAKQYGWELLGHCRTIWGKRYAQAMFKVR